MKKTIEEQRARRREYARKWRAAHPEYRQTDEFKKASRENAARWRKENPEKVYVIQARYFAKKAGGKFVPLESSTTKRGE